MSDARSARAAQRGPTFRDWALLAIGLTFCILALLMFRSNWRLAVSTLAIFGGATAMFIVIILRKRRARQFAATATDIAVAAGSELRMSRAYPLMLGGGMALVGLVLALIDPSSPLLLRGCGAIIAAFGIGVIGATFTGHIGRQYLRFEADGLALGRRGYVAMLPWGAIASIVEFEISDNPCVGLQIADPTAVVTDPPAASAKFLKEVQKNRRWYGQDLVMMATHYGVDGAPLAAAIARYASDPAARANLVRTARDRPVATATAR